MRDVDATGSGTRASRAPEQRLARRLGAGFAALVGLTLALMALGALVRAHEAGLACPDWPLCFGEWVPRMDLQVAFEYSHRVFAGGVSLIFVGLAAACLARPLRAVVARHLLVAGLLLAAQVLLGALTVWLRLASWTVTAHLLTANAFVVTLLWTSLRLREHALPERARPAATTAARAAAAGLAALLVLQVALGGLVSSSQAGLACPEWPACNGGVWFPSTRGAVGLHLAHRWNGHALLAAYAAAAWLARRDPGLARATRWALGLVAAQVLVGIANVRLGLPVEVTGLHSALAALLVLATAWTLREVWLRPDAESAAEVAKLARAGY
jgi:cytochrome c oxidase assembly protein subunit 15